jgi:hypothetical protein
MENFAICAIALLAVTIVIISAPASLVIMGERLQAGCNNAKSLKKNVSPRRGRISSLPDRIASPLGSISSCRNPISPLPEHRSSPVNQTPPRPNSIPLPPERIHPGKIAARPCAHARGVEVKAVAF